MPPAITPSRTERLSRPQQVAEAIKQWVMENGWQPGDRLPSEVELIDRFGMAKGTIREAVRILEAQGLVKSRTGPGGGVFVHQVSEERATALLGNYFYFQQLSIDDLYQIREALEPELAASLAGKLDEDQLAALESVMECYAEPAQNAEEEREQHIASLRFHALLAEMSDNRLLRFLIRFTANMLADVTVSRRLYALPNRKLWASGIDYQSRLVAALRRGDSGAARQILRDHMRGAHRLMRLQEAELTQRFLPEIDIL
ncbi:FadR/GntR family transcriptional regulator [Roseinatronobacter sp. S2]|uniref:FadR/GntR family transcriptional regulator n=1 Tax=Roseinatronobacter sp. S2 TaxID=3035471 RepID=UPI00240F668D|nr:FCD domain-containing protein [Roseinatronobacter sp. S2]WFE75029.1 FCD domain-containing protein [Roseinatronobacter sp. S2]